ncbi:MAG TPA: PBP1A family penicillin-binding protein [Stellaceae bacterium]|nr:PBP1A family penicillin-binding protein [Stellaceae bacterium]
MADRPLRVDADDRLRSGGNPKRGGRKPPVRRKSRGVLGSLLKVAILVFLWAGIVGGCALGYFALTLPDTSQLAVAERRPSVTIRAADGTIVATFGDLFGEPLTLKQIAPDLPKAVIATEDRRFYSHFGVDPIGLLRAAWADLSAGHVVQGGSTITQQLAKIAFLTPERSFSRKIRETLMALWLERRFTKDQILEIYLNRVYLGAGTYGVDAAAHRYFGKSARKLDLFECAVIAGLLKAPTRFSPAHDRDKAEARAAQVLDNMVDAGYITAAQAAGAEKEGPTITARAAERPGSRYFADWIAEQVREFAGMDDKDLTVTTTFDPRLQAAAEAAIGDTVARAGQKYAVSQGALVAMSPDGAVRAMVGGRKYGDSQFNRATQAERQPGSAFKPFVYLAGLESGLRPDDHFTDAPVRVGNWQPRNYTGRYLGDVTMAEALAESINTVAVQVAQHAGIANVVAVANRLGIASTLTPDASIALGTDEVNLLELVSAYAAFANGGTGVMPYGISEIRDGAGKVLYRRAGGGPGRVIAPENVAMMNQMLEGVVEHGTGKSARLPRPMAGKTGTTQEYRDAWFIGYTANLVAGVWLGNDDNTPMKKVTGGTLPAATWRNFMLAAIGKSPAEPLPSAPTDSPSTAGPSPLDNLLRGLGLTNGTPVPAPPDRMPGPAPVSDIR